MIDEIINAETLSGFPAAKNFCLTTPGGVLVINLYTADGRLIRQEITAEQLVRVFVESVPHVVRV